MTKIVMTTTRPMSATDHEESDDDDCDGDGDIGSTNNVIAANATTNYTKSNRVLARISEFCRSTIWRQQQQLCPKDAVRVESGIVAWRGRRIRDVNTARRRSLQMKIWRQ